MSDLISRSELLEEIEKYKFGAISNDVERGYVKETIFNFIEFQPTAYDIDKVVEELENNSFITVNQEEVQTKRKDIQSYISVEKEVVLLKDAIEIVKQNS